MLKMTIVTLALLSLAGCTDPSAGSKQSSGSSPNERQTSKDPSNNSTSASATGKGVNAADVNGMTGTVGTSKEPGTAAGQSGEGTSRPEEPKK